jgi:hypothetical protein
MWSLLAALVGKMLLLKPSPERLIADLDFVNRQKLLAGMGGAEFFVRITAERDGFVLYLICYPIMGPLSSGLVANASIAFRPDVAGNSPYLPIR